MPNSRDSLAANQSHLESLDNRHALLADKIEQEQKSRAADPMLLRRWKAEKLKLKDEIEQKRKILS